MRCPNCGVVLEDPALQFLHTEMHKEPRGREHPYTLRGLPYVLMPRVAKLMQDYANNLQQEKT
jgi:hypothetical protein